MYLHYQPSYNHLHVHFTHVNYEAPGSDCLRAHTIEDVIDNLTLDGEFYAKKTLLYVVRDSDELHKAYQAAGYFD
jgi:m7GpppX diphosphatase